MNKGNRSTDYSLQRNSAQFCDLTEKARNYRCQWQTEHDKERHTRGDQQYNL